MQTMSDGLAHLSQRMVANDLHACGPRQLRDSWSKRTLNGVPHPNKPMLLYTRARFCNSKTFETGIVYTLSINSYADSNGRGLVVVPHSQARHLLLVVSRKVWHGK